MPHHLTVPPHHSFPPFRYGISATLCALALANLHGVKHPRGLFMLVGLMGFASQLLLTFSLRHFRPGSVGGGSGNIGDVGDSDSSGSGSGSGSAGSGRGLLPPPPNQWLDSAHLSSSWGSFTAAAFRPHLPHLPLLRWNGRTLLSLCLTAASLLLFVLCDVARAMGVARWWGAGVSLQPIVWVATVVDCMAAFVTHAVHGRAEIPGYQLWMPFRGSPIFVILQSFGWILLGVMINLVCVVGDVASIEANGVVSCIGWIGCVSQMLLLCSLRRFDADYGVDGVALQGNAGSQGTQSEQAKHGDRAGSVGSEVVGAESSNGDAIAAAIAATTPLSPPPVLPPPLSPLQWSRIGGEAMVSLLLASWSLCLFFVAGFLDARAHAVNAAEDGGAAGVLGGILPVHCHLLAVTAAPLMFAAGPLAHIGGGRLHRQYELWQVRYPMRESRVYYCTHTHTHTHTHRPRPPSVYLHAPLHPP